MEIYIPRDLSCNVISYDGTNDQEILDQWPDDFEIRPLPDMNGDTAPRLFFKNYTKEVISSGMKLAEQINNETRARESLSIIDQGTIDRWLRVPT